MKLILLEIYFCQFYRPSNAATARAHSAMHLANAVECCTSAVALSSLVHVDILFSSTPRVSICPSSRGSVLGCGWAAAAF